jgi:hypothetical protein
VPGRRVALLAVAGALLLGDLSSSSAWHDTPPPRRIRGVDAHDGTVYRDGATYYMVGTSYRCGFRWRPGGDPSNFCGFSVYQSHDGRAWRFVRRLFEPWGWNDWAGGTWQELCAGAGDGCFNPRMVRRSDGVWILAFNAPYDFRVREANAYYFMGCNGPAGPCGREAGPPFGSTVKPRMQICYGNGDFTIVDVGGGEAWIYCTRQDQTLSAEKLDVWWTNGVGVGSHELAGVEEVESPGVALFNGRWILTFSQPNCGYCDGTTIGYATRRGSQPWRYQGLLSLHSCGGQARTLFWLDGHLWQWIDDWDSTADDQGDAPVIFAAMGDDDLGLPLLACPL